MRCNIGKAALVGLAIGALGTGAASAGPATSAAVNVFSSGDSSVTRAKVADKANRVFELDVAAAGWAGFSLPRAGGEDLADLSAPSFEFKGDDAATASGGSPRLVVRLSGGGQIELRPKSWTTDWTVVDAADAGSVDTNGGGCGYRYDVDWATAQACFGDVEVTSVFVVSDSGWLNGDHVLWVDSVEFDGTTYTGSANA
jgi:hypothetical protein